MRLPEGAGAGLARLLGVALALTGALTLVLILDTLEFFGMVNSCRCVRLRARVRTREMLIVRSKPHPPLAPCQGLVQGACGVLLGMAVRSCSGNVVFAAAGERVPEDVENVKKYL